jgi:hypothetical protein
MILQLGQSGHLFWHQVVAAWHQQAVLAALGAMLQLGMWLLTVLGLGLMLVSLLRMIGRGLLGLITHGAR